MVDLLEQLFSVIWQKKIVPRQCREVYTLSMQLLLILKPACPSCNAPSLSKHCTNLLLRILQNTFPTTLSKVIPL